MAAISPGNRLPESPLPRWEHFSHQTDIGIRGIAEEVVERYLAEVDVHTGLTGPLLCPDKTEA